MVSLNEIQKALIDNLVNKGFNAEVWVMDDETIIEWEENGLDCSVTVWHLDCDAYFKARKGDSIERSINFETFEKLSESLLKIKV